MLATLEKRKLDNIEISAIDEEIKKFPNPLTERRTWKWFKRVYILSFEKDLIGVCAIRKLDDWIKPGPFVVFQKYHGQGFGKKILKAILDDYSNNNIFIGSRNGAVAKLALNLGFREVLHFWELPNRIKFYFLETISEYLSLNYIKECIRKRSIQEGPFRFFIKRTNQST